MATININKMSLALVTKDETGVPANLVYEAPEYVAGIQSFTAKVKSNTGTNYEEGILVDQDTILTDVEISFDLGHFSSAQYCKFLGHHMAVGGGTYSLQTDVAPYLAILIEYTKSGGKKGYKVFYKGVLTEADDSAKQTEGKITYENITVTATFQPTRNNGMWKYTVEEDDADCPTDIATKFFTSVIVPTEKTVVVA